MSSAQKGKRTASKDVVESIYTVLSKEPLPGGMYASHRRVKPPSYLVSYPDQELVPYILLLHDINVLRVELLRRIARRKAESSESRDYSEQAEILLDYRKYYRDSRICPKCGSTKLRGTGRWSSGSKLVVFYRFRCLRCGWKFTREMPSNIAGRTPRIIAMSTEDLLKGKNALG